MVKVIIIANNKDNANELMFEIHKIYESEIVCLIFSTNNNQYLYTSDKFTFYN